MRPATTAAHSRRLHVMRALILAAGIAGLTGTAHAQRPDEAFRTPKWILMPAVPGWFAGKPALYLSTEASDPAVATANHLTYVARLGNAANTDAVDDIYTVTNFKQSNILPSAPHPEGPGNTDPNYTPLWQLSTVTWASGATPHLLTSEQAVRDAQAHGLVTVTKTNVVVNCPVIYTPSGGLFPGAHIIDFDR